MSKARDAALRVALKYMPRQIREYRLWYSDFVMKADYSLLYDYIVSMTSKAMIRFGTYDLFLAKLGRFIDDHHPDDVFEKLPECIYILSLIAVTDLLMTTVYKGDGHSGVSKNQIKRVISRRIDDLYIYR